MRNITELRNRNVLNYKIKSYVTNFDCASPVGCAGETPTIPAKTNFGTFSVTDLVSIRGMSASA